MVELYMLEQLLAFARCGTLSGAAITLHISQPALSRTMKKLEEEMGMSLFDRAGRTISLNDGGRIAASHASKILEEEHAMEEALHRWDKSRHTVSVGSCSRMPLDHLMPSLLLEFPEQAITTEIVDNDDTLEKRLIEDDLQIAILHEPPRDSRLHGEPYLYENICLFVPTSHPLAQQKSVTLAEVSRYTILVYRHIGFWFPLCQKAIPAAHLLVQDSMDAMDELADSSTTAMFNSDARMKDGYLSKGRTAIPITDPCMHATYYVCCRLDRREKYRALLQTARKEAGQQK